MTRRILATLFTLAALPAALVIFAVAGAYAGAAGIAALLRDLWRQA